MSDLTLTQKVRAWAILHYADDARAKAAYERLVDSQIHTLGSVEGVKAFFDAIRNLPLLAKGSKK